MIKLKSKRFCRGSFKFGGNGGGSNVKGSEKGSCNGGISEIKWELRPGGMLVQKRESGDSVGELITLKVSTVSQWHDISIEATSTFGKPSNIFWLSFWSSTQSTNICSCGRGIKISQSLYMYLPFFGE